MLRPTAMVGASKVPDGLLDVPPRRTDNVATALVEVLKHAPREREATLTTKGVGGLPEPVHDRHSSQSWLKQVFVFRLL